MKIEGILEWLDSEEMTYNFRGDKNIEVNGFSSLSNYKKGSLTWVKKQTYYENEGHDKDILCAVVQENLNVDIANRIISRNSKEIFFAILKCFWGNSKFKVGIGDGTRLIGDIKIAENVSIGCNCVLRGDITIGNGTVLEDNVSIMNRVTIGDNCIIHSGVVIGGDGFGFYYDENGMQRKIEHFGEVIVGNEVEIGANTCIDRGTIDGTKIGNNVKIDNLVHIAHNVKVGDNACIIAGALVCGSVEIGKDAYIAPGGIVKNQIKIGRNGYVGLGGVVVKPVDEEMVVVGVPARPIRKLKDGDR